MVQQGMQEFPPPGVAGNFPNMMIGGAAANQQQLLNQQMMMNPMMFGGSNGVIVTNPSNGVMLTNPALGNLGNTNGVVVNGGTGTHFPRVMCDTWFTREIIVIL